MAISSDPKIRGRSYPIVAFTRSSMSGVQANPRYAEPGLVWSVVGAVYNYTNYYGLYSNVLTEQSLTFLTYNLSSLLCITRYMKKKS